MRYPTFPWSASVAAATLAAALVQAPALAIPGTPVSQFQVWAKANPALHKLSKQLTNQDTGQPYFTATFQTGSTAGQFQADVADDGKISNESVAVDSSNESYDILKHLDFASSMIGAVYGTATADDFKSAAQVGRWNLQGFTHATVLYRGKLYGYEASLFSVQLLPPTKIDAEAKRLAACVKSDCAGD
jgi:hypothetical protein